MRRRNSSTAIGETAPPKSGEVVGIQYLRGVAALMVVACHLGPQLRHLAYSGPWLNSLASGVDIFFVISGFIMWVTTSRRPTTPFNFLRKRCIRIVPLYWAVTGAVVMIMLIAPDLLQSSRFDAPHVVASFLFIPYHHPVLLALEPVVIPGWTLNYEMFFYVVFALSLAAPARLRFITTVVTLVLLVSVGAIFAFPDLTLARFYTGGAILEFAIGMALGWAFVRNVVFKDTPPMFAGMLIIGGLIACVLIPAGGEPFRQISRELAATAVVAGVLALEVCGKLMELNLLSTLGDASYSIYLSHMLVLSSVSQGFRKLHLSQTPLVWTVFCVVGFVISAAIGWLIYFFIEQRLLALFGRPKSRPPFVIASS